MPSKKQTYLLLALFLGALLFDIFYDALEISYRLASAAPSGGPLVALGRAVFIHPLLLEMLFDLLGICFGYFAGRAWWRIIYVEDRRHKHYKLDW